MAESLFTASEGLRDQFFYDIFEFVGIFGSYAVPELGLAVVHVVDGGEV